jgi:hypothetical protein
MESMAPWIVLAAYCLVNWLVTPRKVNQEQFFDGRNNAGSAPGVWLVAMSAIVHSGRLDRGVNLMNKPYWPFEIDATLFRALHVLEPLCRPPRWQ